MSDERRPRRGLPSSGLAEEILAALARGELELEREEQQSPAEVPAVPVDRIYTFTDALQLGEEEEEEVESYQTWVEFRLADGRWALPVEQVQEILRPVELTPVPHAPFPVLGVFNLRGRVVPLLDLRARLGLPTRPPEEASRIVVVESETRRLALLVDAVENVVELAASAIRPPGQEAEAPLRGVYAAAGGELRLLDLTALLALPESRAAKSDRPPGD